MAKPYIMPATADPIDIDPGVPYHYVVAVSGATAFRIEQNPDFTAIFQAPVITLKFVSKAPLVPTVYSLTFVASNADGNSSQTLNFRVSGKQISAIATKFSCIADGTINIKFADGKSILQVGDAVYAGPTIYYIVKVGSGAFQMSATPGGAAIVPVALSFYLFVCTSSDASSAIWVGDTSNLQDNAPVALAYDTASAQPLESALTGQLYVKIVDGYHIKLSATTGGSFIAPAQVSYTLGKVLVLDQSGARAVPDITTVASLAAATSSSVSIAITTDIAVDTWSAEGLPSGLSIPANSNLIGGIPPSTNATYPIVLRVTKGAESYRRYLVLTVGAGGPLAQTGGSIFTFSDVGGGSSLRITYDGDFTQAQLAGPPVYEIPFPHDPKPYLYKLAYWQFFDNYTELPLGTPGPIGGTYVGGTPGSFKGIGGGIIEFWREYALVPDSRNEYESFVYSYQIAGTVNYQVVNNISEIPLSSNSRIQFDYFRTDNPGSIVLPRAPRIITVPLGTGSTVLFMNGWSPYFPIGIEILAEDAVIRNWKGNIYERRQRFVKWPNLLNSSG